MKLSIMGFLAIGFLLLSGSAFAQEGLAGGAISISASEKGFFEPDTAELAFSVETQKAQKTVELAVQENAGKAQTLVNALNVFVNEQIGDSISTSKYSVQPVYEWNEKQKKSILAGYMVINEVLVKIHHTELVGQVIDKAVASGANKVESINFILAKETAYCGGLITKAAGNARQEAQSLASSLGVKLGKLKSASPTCAPVRKTGYTGAPMLMEQAQGPSRTPVEAGQIELKATVNVVFHIE
ncbi:MAG: SIMPL domain-containing protein [Nitrospiraceae bacterium]|nr:SIMPL domain-containing protein [Nitrospiraceae bacterium]